MEELATAQGPAGPLTPVTLAHLPQSPSPTRTLCPKMSNPPGIDLGFRW